MKAIYNWLKEFVDIAASPAEIASRLALSGTNIGSVENGPHGAVIDAEVGSTAPIASAITESPANSAPSINCRSNLSCQSPPKARQK